MPRVKKNTATPQERILAAAFEEFATNRFKIASTNQIAKEAKVAKGLLFHYFKNKEELYLAVFERTVLRVTEIFWSQLQPNQADIFERLRYWSVLRLKMVHEDPKMYHFMSMAMTDCPETMKPKFMKILEPIQRKVWEELTRDADISKLRSGVTLQQTIEVLTIFTAGLEQRMSAFMSATPDHGLAMLEALNQQVHSYLELIRDGLYK
jgi:TetR/AcrR family transcriptional regulator